LQHNYREEHRRDGHAQTKGAIDDECTATLLPGGGFTVKANAVETSSDPQTLGL
jgi:hypothetical protein